MDIEESWVLLIFKDGSKYFAKKVDGSNIHWVTECGKVYSDTINNFMKQRTQGNGYLSVGIYGKAKMVHRLVAYAFIKNPSPSVKIYVNHKDGDKKNNNVSNLEWVTHSENIIHAHKTGIMKYQGKEIQQMDKDGNIIAAFKSMTEAERKFRPNGNGSSVISNSILKNTNAYGFYWKLKDADWTHKNLRNRCILQVDTEGKVRREFEMIKDTAKYLNISVSTLYEYMKNKKIVDGYKYEYKPVIKEQVQDKFDVSFLKNTNVWKPINSYEKYFISNDGKIFSTHKNIFLIQRGDNLGYKFIGIKNKGATKTFSVHRLVAMHFIPNPENKPEVDHIDSDPSNNNVSNLTWATRKENMKRVVDKETNNGFVAIIHYDKEGNELARYKNIVTAAKATGNAVSKVYSKILRKNYEWKRVRDVEK